MGDYDYKQQRSQQMEMRRQYTGTWAVEMFKAPLSDPLCCLGSILCPMCASYTLRTKALGGDMSRYTCCQGYSFLRPNCVGETSCPELCLCCETALCFPTSVMSTRFLLQDTMHVREAARAPWKIENTQCDDNLIALVICMESLACFCQFAACITGSQEIGECANTISCIADQVYCSVCACMQTQHKIQIAARDRGDFQPPPPAMMVPPGMQQMGMMPAGGPAYFPGQQPYPHPGMPQQPYPQPGMPQQQVYGGYGNRQ